MKGTSSPRNKMRMMVTMAGAAMAAMAAFPMSTFEPARPVFLPPGKKTRQLAPKRTRGPTKGDHPSSSPATNKSRQAFIAAHAANPCNRVPGRVLHKMMWGSPTQAQLERRAQSWLDAKERMEASP